MKKLYFRLEANNKVEIDEDLNYYRKDNTLFIKNKEAIYKVNLSNKTFIKEDKESIIYIDAINNNITITLKENNLSFDMNLVFIEFINEDEKVLIKYTLDDDENTYNCIFIEY